MWSQRLGGEEPSCWAAAVAAIELWQHLSDGRPSPRRDHDRARYERWTEQYETTRAWLREDRRSQGRVGEARLTAGQVAHLTEVCQDGEDLDALYAVAYAIDFAAHHVFPAGYRDSLEATEVELAPGELFPVSDASWPAAAGLRPGTRPASLTDPPDGQLAHARRFEPVQIAGRAVSVVLDFVAERDLSAVFEQLHTLAGAHPNRADSEFSFGAGSTSFPIAPALEDQGDRLERSLRSALRREAGVVVFPELSVRAEHVARLAQTLDEHGDHTLVIAGSEHREVDGVASNVASVLLPDLDALEHHKLVGFSSELSSGKVLREGIDDSSPAVLRVWQARHWRLAVVVCKDLLDAGLTRLLAHLGANVVLVPAMSPKADSYEDRLRQLRTDAQALGLLVNAPAIWEGRRPAQPDAVLVRPSAQGAVSTRTLHGTRGLTLFKLVDNS